MLLGTVARYVPHYTLAAPAVVSALWAFVLPTLDGRESRDPLGALARMLGSMRPELGIRGVGHGILRELLRLAKARHAVVALEYRSGGRLVLAELADKTPEDADLPVRGLPAASRSTYFFSWPADRTPAGNRFAHGALDVRVIGVEGLLQFAPPAFREAHPSKRLYAIRFNRGSEWEGRAFLLDPQPREDGDAFVCTFELMLRQLLPTLASLCDIDAVRRQAAAEERARLGRELHDGIVQGLIGVELEVEAIRRSLVGGRELTDKLGRLRERLRGEVAGLRALLRDGRSPEIDPSQLALALEDLVARFEQESDITAKYISRVDVGDLGLSPRVCGEIVRIVQEALVNVRRHSGARHVVVQVACEGDELTLSIEDDGRGFFDGGAGPRPAVIHERAQSLGGRVRMTPGTPGLRLEVTLPRKGIWTSRA